MSKQELKQATPAMVPKLMNGGIAGIVGVTIMFPMDLVKTRLQNQTVGPNGEVQYKNIFDCFIKTYKAEGYFGMYRGSAVNILLVSPEKAIKLAGNDFYRWLLALPDGSLNMPRQMVAGGLAGLNATIVTTPMELLKIQMQDAGRLVMEAKKEGRVFKPPSSVELIRNLLNERGFFGLYKGTGATALREIVFCVLYFPFFAHLNSIGADKNGVAPFRWSFISGLTSAIFAAWACTPMDVVKTRLQATDKYKSWMHAFVTTLSREGPRAFFKGALCRVLFIGPLFGIAQATYYLGIAERILSTLGLHSLL